MAKSLEISTHRRARRVGDAQGGQWIYTFSGMRFANPRCGWAYSRGQLLRTVDAGIHWKDCVSWTNDSLVGVEDVQPLDCNVCWILVSYASHELRCLYTADGGLTWAEKSRFFSEVFRIIDSDLFFVNANHGWVLVGEIQGSRLHASLRSTTDGGQNWAAIPLKIKSRPRKIVFADSLRGWILASRTRRSGLISEIHSTSDGGNSWTLVARIRGTVTTLFAQSADVLFIAGLNGLLARSADGGRHWKKIETRTRLAIEALDFKDSIGVAVGCAGTVKSRKGIIILETRDGGSTWRRIDSPVTDAFSQIYLAAWDRGVLMSPYALYRFKFS